MINKLYSTLRLRRACRLIRASGLFDPQWYLQEYPDVAEKGVDPLTHYLKYGVLEGRSPGTFFNDEFCQTQGVPGAPRHTLFLYFKYGLQSAPKLKPLPLPAAAPPKPAPVVASFKVTQPTLWACCVCLEEGFFEQIHASAWSALADQESVFVFIKSPVNTEHLAGLLACLPNARWVVEPTDSHQSFQSFLPVLLNESVGFVTCLSQRDQAVPAGTRLTEPSAAASKLAVELSHHFYVKHLSVTC